MSTGSIIDRSSALFFLTSAVNMAALVGGGELLIVRAPDGPYELVRAGIPIIGGLAAAAAALAIPIVIRRSPAPTLAELACRPRGRDHPRAAVVARAGYALLRRRFGGSDPAQPRTPISRSVASSGTPSKYASSTCPKIGLAESA
jgi:hypothetical protein